MSAKNVFIVSVCLMATSLIPVQAQTDVQLSLPSPAKRVHTKAPKSQSVESTQECDENKITTSTKPQDGVKLSNKDKRKRKRKSKTTRHTISTMTYDELRDAKNRNLAAKNLEIGIKYAEKMIPLCKDMHELKDLTIELADLCFQNGELEKAGKLYNEFAKLYPGYEKIEHAQHKAILCSFYSILDAERDQTKTKETLELTKKFLDRSDVFTTYSGEVAKIQKQCYQRLIDSEKSILEYYLHRESFKSAQTRIESLKKEYIDAMPELEPQLLTYEIALAEKQKNEKLLKEKQQELLDKFPTYGVVTVTAQQERKINFSNKF